jgi:hypothetical protein
MAKEADFQAVFDQLKMVMKAYEDRLEIKADQPGDYSVYTHYRRKDGYPYAFGAVQIKKNYVSYHLVPVYSFPEILEGISPELKKRMQGKACFNFKNLNPEQLEELGELTRKGFERFKAEGFI